MCVVSLWSLVRSVFFILVDLYKPSKVLNIVRILPMHSWSNKHKWNWWWLSYMHIFFLFQLLCFVLIIESSLDLLSYEVLWGFVYPIFIWEASRVSNNLFRKSIKRGMYEDVFLLTWTASGGFVDTCGSIVAFECRATVVTPSPLSSSGRQKSFN